ncbi:MAG: hypothetical protein ACI9OD_000126 [Limisphaerales bacterium]
MSFLQFGDLQDFSVGVVADGLVVLVDDRGEMNPAAQTLQVDETFGGVVVPFGGGVADAGDERAILTKLPVDFAGIVTVGQQE